MKMECFGNKSLGIDHEWPTQEQIKELPLNKKMKLKRIGYKKQSSNGSLTGFQLEFTNGAKSPLFETEYARNNNKLEYVDIGMSR